MKAMFSPRCCSALIFPSSRRFCWSSPNCAITGPSSWYSDFQIAAHLVCRRTGYVSQGGSAAHAVLQLAPSRMNANASAQSSSTPLASMNGSLHSWLTIAQRNLFCRRSTRMNGRRRSAWPAGTRGGIAGHHCWSNGFNISLPVRACWILAVVEGRMQAISLGAGIALWAWIGRSALLSAGRRRYPLLSAGPRRSTRPSLSGDVVRWPLGRRLADAFP